MRPTTVANHYTKPPPSNTDVAVCVYRQVLLRACMMLIVPMLCHGWMAATTYQTLTAVDQKPESTVPDDQKKTTTPRPPSSPPAPPPQRASPVSYTHLTLPTIYSV